jgi:hypothetical protein
MSVPVNAGNQPEKSAEDASNSHTKPDPTRKIMWAPNAEPSLDRNWLTEDLIHLSEQHWHCSRQEAIERLLAKT